MWFGTRDGLNKYDGYKITPYMHDPGNKNSISNGKVAAILEDTSGILWIATINGLNKFDRKREVFTHYFSDAGGKDCLANNDVRSLCEDSEGILWVGTYGGGVCRFDRENNTFFNYSNDKNDPNSLSDNRINVIKEDRYGFLWIGTEKGLNKFDKKKQQFIRYPNDPGNRPGLSKDRILSISEDKSGVIWFGTFAGGLCRFDRNTESFFFYRHDPYNKKSVSHINITCLYHDSKGNFWIGTYGGGLCRFDESEEKFINYKSNPFQPRNLSNDRIWSIYECRSGIIWIGTHGGGVNKLDPKMAKIPYYNNDPLDDNSIDNNSVYGILKDSSGLLWIGTTKGLNKINRETGAVIHYNNDPDNALSITPAGVYCLVEDYQKNLWIGTNGGLNKFIRKTGKFVRYVNDSGNPNSISENSVISVCLDESGDLWAGTRSGGLNRLIKRTGKFIRYKHNSDDSNRISNNRINVIYKDNSGGIWIGTDGGLDKYERKTGRFKSYRYEQGNSGGLNNNIIGSIHEDKNGILWIGTKGGGLNRFDQANETFSYYTMTDGLPNNHIYGILGDDFGNLWISSNKGLSRFNPKTEEFKNYDENDGLQSNEFNAGAYFKDKNGELFFGGIGGLNAFFPDDITLNQYIPPIVLTNLQINNETVVPGDDSPAKMHISELKEIELTREHKVFSFEFAALDYTSPEKNRYSYIMEGLDDSWHNIGTRNYVSFTGLPAGTYTFKVKGSNNDGVWNEEYTDIKVTLVPPFWRSTWFKIIILVSSLVFVFIYYEQKVRSIKKQRRKLEFLVDERTKELNTEREELKKARDELEIRVNERTFELSEANKSLQTEMTERKKAEEGRLKLEKHLYQSQKMESIGRLAGGIAHDFNNILGGILGFAEILKMKFNDETTTEGNAAEVILSGAERAANLTKQLLGFARKGKFQPVPLELNGVINQVLKVSEKIFEKNIIVDTDLGKIPNIIADQNQIDQILTNLFINAKDAMPEGGDLSIKSEEVNLDKNDVKSLTGIKPGRYVKVAISDTGVGMPKHIRDRIFEPFFTTKDEGKGTGLGLATTYGIIKNHGGHIRVYSEPGVGTVFTIYMPVTEEEPPKQIKEKEIVKGEGTILLIDDEKSVRNAVKNQLQILGYKVLLAEDGANGLEIFLEYKDKINLVMIDMIMPKMAGKETFLALKGVKPDVKAILMSGFSQDGKGSELINQGAKEFLQKPFRLQELSMTVARVLGK